MDASNSIGLQNILARGDKKKALTRLRGGGQHQTHHFSTFRTGMMLGLAVPALVDGLVESEYLPFLFLICSLISGIC